jgi:hypothetical protein
MDGTTVEYTYIRARRATRTTAAGEFKVHDLENLGDQDMIFMTVESIEGSANKPLPIPDTVRLKARKRHCHSGQAPQPSKRASRNPSATIGAISHRPLCCLCGAIEDAATFAASDHDAVGTESFINVRGVAAELRNRLKSARTAGNTHEGITCGAVTRLSFRARSF